MSIHSCSWAFFDYYFMLKLAKFEGTWHPSKDLATPKCMNPTR